MWPTRTWGWRASASTRRRYTAGGKTTSDTLSIAVSNAAPVAVADTFTGFTGSYLVAPAAGVLVNDTDTNAGQTLAAQVVTTTTRGMLSPNPDGSFVNSPTGGYSRPDSCTHQTSDGVAQSIAATVAVGVQPVGCDPRPRVQTAPSADGSKLTVVDGCGAWPTFVGGGTAAGF